MCIWVCACMHIYVHVSLHACRGQRINFRIGSTFMLILENKLELIWQVSYPLTYLVDFKDILIKLKYKC